MVNRSNDYEIEDPQIIQSGWETAGSDESVNKSTRDKKGKTLNSTRDPNDRRLIEDWLPIRELSIEAVRERAGAVPNPATHQLHVWWARRPLAPSRAAVAASLLKADSNRLTFLAAMGTYPEIVADQTRIDQARSDGVRTKQGYSNRRAFTHNLTAAEFQWFKQHLALPNPKVIDLTAGGGSIPFETGRLGLPSVANEINPVAGLILRATCQWPQSYGNRLSDAYGSVSRRFKKRVRELTNHVYPGQHQNRLESEDRPTTKAHATRRDQTYLWARVVNCPSCAGKIPLSPNWRLSSGGVGIQIGRAHV